VNITNCKNEAEMYNIKLTYYSCHVRLKSAKWLFMKLDKGICTKLSAFPISGWTLRAVLDTVQYGIYIYIYIYVYIYTFLHSSWGYLQSFNREEHRSLQASMAGVAQTIVSQTTTPCTDISEDASNKRVMLHDAIDKGLFSERKMFRIRHRRMKHTEWREDIWNSFTNRKVANAMIRLCS
jgi:hypothetical protein